MRNGMTREDVINGLELCTENGSFAECISKDCPFIGGNIDSNCIEMLMRNALTLLKGSFTPQQVYDTVIEHAQHDKRFKLGDKIDYSFTDVVDILNIELMCKAGDM